MLSQDKDIIQDIIELKEENERLKNLLSPEQMDIIESERIRVKLSKEIKELKQQITHKQYELSQLSDELLYESFGLYESDFQFTCSEEYELKLKELRNFEKLMLKNDMAVSSREFRQIDLNSQDCKIMIKDIKKLILRGFNAECDKLISEVNYFNFDSCVKLMEQARHDILELGYFLNLEISEDYYNQKRQELSLAFEYIQTKNKEAAELSHIKNERYNDELTERSIQLDRMRCLRKKDDCLNELEYINNQISADPDNQELMFKKTDLEKILSKACEELQQIEERAANERCGYILILSNIGSYGKGVFYIGMTIKFIPEDYIRELNNSLVPFPFDVHALLFSQDVAGLRAAIEKSLETRRVNTTDPNCHFYYVSPEDIKKVIEENYDKPVEFTITPQAEQYRISQKTHLTNKLRKKSEYDADS